jgi:hypothetical protein
MPQRRWVSAGSALLLAASILLLLRLERLAVAPALVAVLGLVALLWSTQWWKLRRSLAVAMAIDLCLIFLYSWSLGDRIHVTVETTSTGYLGIAGGNYGSLRTRKHLHGTIGIYAGATGDYNVTPVGEAAMPAGANSLTWAGDVFRFLTPLPAWSNLSLVEYKNGKQISPGVSLTTEKGSWSTNPRGDLEGSRGAIGFLPGGPTSRFVFSGDLMRPDGLQGIFVGANRGGAGYFFGIRMDRRQAWWLYWKNGTQSWTHQGTGTFALSQGEMIKRLLRVSLPSAILGLLMLLVALPLYAVAARLFLFSGRFVPHQRLSIWSNRFNRRRAGDIAAILVGIFAVVVMGWIASVLYRAAPNVQDGVAYLFQAKTFALGRLWAPAPAVPAFFREEFVLIFHGHWFSKYPPGWAVPLSLGVLARVPWLTGPVLSAAGIACHHPGAYFALLAVYRQLVLPARGQRPLPPIGSIPRRSVGAYA